MTTTAQPKVRRAIGIVRVSQVNGREGESFAPPGEQRDRIRAACERDNLRLVDVHEELDVSGGKPLDRRERLRLAVEAIEDGRADVIAAAYFDRLFRSLAVQAEVVERVERRGGQVLAVDVGQVTNGSAGAWLSGTSLGMMSEYMRRSAAERSAAAQQRAIDRGIVPWPNIPPGFDRAKDEPLVPNADAPIALEALTMRAEGATVDTVRAFLAEHGIHRSHHGVQSMLRDRLYLGEIHFGNYKPNLTAHEPIVRDRDLWRRVQSASVPRGRRAKSERLLARLGVLRCGSCGARMVVGTSNNSAYFLYRCPPTGDCTRRVTIGAEIAEKVVTDAVRAALADAEGRASMENNAREAEVALERAQASLDAAIRAFDGLGGEQAAVERLGELRDERDGAQERVDHLGNHRAVVAVSASEDWDRLSLDARRALIRATVDEVRVARGGRGAERVTVKLVSE